MKKVLLLAIFSSMIIGLNAQTVRFGMQVGAAVPLGDFAQDDQHPENGGFARTGFDIKFIGERIMTSNLVVGVNLGYNMFGVDEDALKKFIDPDNPESVRTESQAFQNFNLQGRIGYNWKIDEGLLQVIPVVDAGIGIFNSAYYLYQDDNGTTYLRNGNSALALLITPGLDVIIKVNESVGLKAYGNYQFANYRVDEEYKILGSGSDQVIYQTENYKYSSLCFGLGATISL